MSRVVPRPQPAPSSKATIDARAVRAGQLSLSGKRSGLRALLPFLGPAMIAAIAYVDPGNYATNIQSGSTFGYKLLWVVVLANAMAMLVQILSAKLGIATGKNLPELCRDTFSRPVTMTMWIVAELAAMATDLAEFLGASLALNLLLHIPLLIATFATGVVTYLVLMLDRFGFRPLEIFIGALLGVIALCYLLETFISEPNWSQVAYHSIVPWLGGSDSIFLSVGIVGATIMPHAVYLHSGLTKQRIIPQDTAQRRGIYRFEKVDVIIAMCIAGAVNIAMMYMAASVFYGTGHTQVADISTAYRTLTPLLGPAAAGVFLTSLLASGISSSSVGTMAGQVIMQGFVGFKIPMWLRRTITMMPTVVIVALGVNPMQTLVLSQVILSIALPVPVITLVYFTNKSMLMGDLVNGKWTRRGAYTVAAIVVALNLLLLYTVIK